MENVKMIAGYVQVTPELIADSSPSLRRLFHEQLRNAWRRTSLRESFPDWWEAEQQNMAVLVSLHEERRRIDLGWWGRFKEDHAWLFTATPVDDEDNY